MKQYQNQTFDQKPGSADSEVSGSKKGMPGVKIGRAELDDDGGSEGNSRERKTDRNGSDSNAH